MADDAPLNRIDRPEVRRVAQLATKLVITGLKDGPVEDIIAALSLSLAGVLSALPPAEHAAAKWLALEQLDAAIATMRAG